MKQLFATLLGLGLLSLGIVGCADKATVTKETTISTPGGTTTVTVEKEVTKSGDNPPAAQR